MSHTHHDHRETIHAFTLRAIATAVLFLVFCVQVYILANTRSMTVKNDLIHTLADMVAYLAVTVGTLSLLGHQSEWKRRFMDYSTRVSILLLVGGGVLILMETIPLLHTPSVLAPGLMAKAGIAGVLGNLLAFVILERVPHAHHSHAHDSFVAHVVTDALTSGFVLVAAGGKHFFGWNRIDPILAMVGSIMMIYYGVKLWGNLDQPRH